VGFPFSIFHGGNGVDHFLGKSRIRNTIFFSAKLEKNPRFRNEKVTTKNLGQQPLYCMEQTDLISHKLFKGLKVVF